MASQPSLASPLAPRATARDTFASPSVVLFLAFVASQAGVLVLSPILSDVADDFGVSVAAAGQLRILAAPLAVVAALVAGRLLTRFSPRALLVASALLAVGSLASAAAPSFALLAVAQIPMWIGISMILTAASQRWPRGLSPSDARGSSRTRSQGRRPRGSSACRSSASSPR